jgi:hypothetical protein
MSAEAARLERMIVMAERLIHALEADIAALRLGNPSAMRTTDPEIQKLSAQYGREASGFNPTAAKGAPDELRKRFAETTGKFREVLALQMRLVTRVRNASEGMIRAIAEEVERRRAPMRPYARVPAGVPRTSGAMVYNNLV